MPDKNVETATSFTTVKFNTPSFPKHRISMKGKDRIKSVEKDWKGLKEIELFENSDGFEGL